MPNTLRYNHINKMYMHFVTGVQIPGSASYRLVAYIRQYTSSAVAIHARVPQPICNAVAISLLSITAIRHSSH